MVKELLKIANYINELEQENAELKKEIKDLQSDCKEWEDMYEELKSRNKE